MGFLRLIFIVNALIAGVRALNQNHLTNAPKISSNRRSWLTAAASVIGVTAASSPVHALRSVLDDKSQAKFDTKAKDAEKPPTPRKSLQEIFGSDTEARFERPKFERVADRKARELFEAKQAAGQ
jgi:hypothetical protein